MKKRFLSMLLVLCMVFTLFPSAAFAEEAGTPIVTTSVTEGAPLCENHKEHDTDCGYIEAKDAQPCDHLNKDGSYTCAPVLDSGDISGNAATPDDAKEQYTCDHSDVCGYKEAVVGADCTHQCELCKEIIADACVCAVLCTEGLMYPDCPLCAAEGADLARCKGAPAMMMAIPRGAATPVAKTSDLNTAISQASGNMEFQLASGFTNNARVIIPANKSYDFTIDLNGQTLTAIQDGTITHDGTGMLTITDSSGGGAVKNKSFGSYAIYNGAAGTVNISDITVQNITTATNMGTAIYNGAAGTINISGSTMVSAPKNAVFNRGAGTVNISGGTLLASYTSGVVYNSAAGTVNISGGTVENTSTGTAVFNYGTGKITVSGSAMVTSAANNGTICLNGGTAETVVLEISGGTVKNTGTGAAIYNSAKGKVNITGGTVINGGNSQSDIWVGGILVNEANANDILRDGTARYYSQYNTLFLNNANISTAHQVGDSFYGIYSDKSLRLVISGNNAIYSLSANNGDSWGVYVQETLSIEGSGQLTSWGNDVAAESGGIKAGTLEILGGKLKAFGYRSKVSYGICADKIVIKNGDVVASGGVSKRSYGIGAKSITISGGKLMADSNRFPGEWDDSYSIAADSLTISGDNTRADTWGDMRIKKDLAIHSGTLNALGNQYGIRVVEGNIVLGNDDGSGLLWVKAQGGISALSKAPMLKPDAGYYTATGAWDAGQASWIIPQGAPDDDSGGGSTGSDGGGSSFPIGGILGGVATPSKTVIDRSVGGSGAANLLIEAVQNALSNGKSNATASVNFANHTALTADGLKAITDAMAKAVQGKNMKLDTTVQFDQKAGNAVVSRITVDPAKLAAVMPEKLPLGVYFDQQKDAKVQAVSNLIEKYFDNKIVSVVYEQRSPLAVNAEFCAKLNLAAVFGQDQQLYFYTYDNAKNTYAHIAAPDYWVDKNGYAHVTAPLGGSVIITDKPLKQ